MPKSITDYIPTEEEKVLIQAKIDKSLHTAVKAQLDKDGLGWTDIMVASLKKYLDESKDKKQKPA